MQTLSKIREKIDAVDNQLVALLAQRLDLVKEVAEIKKAGGGQVYAPERERQLLNRMAELAGPEYAQDVREIYGALLRLSKKRQRSMMGEVRDAAQDGDGGLRHALEAAECSDYGGKFLKLSVGGASHAPFISLKMENFPAGFQMNLAALHEFMARRAPGQNALSSQRQEADIPQFVSGLEDGVTTGEAIVAYIRNLDARPLDYRTRQIIPRPGHADFTQWVQTGRIPSGGGNHSGRMTAALCLAGDFCLQWLLARGIRISAKLASAGGDAVEPDRAIRAAAQESDSVGGIIQVCVEGLPPGLGGALFQGLECGLSAALFAIPGVKGIEFGGGFGLASLRGSQANDALRLEDGKVLTAGNKHGGLLGGISTGMPLTMRLAMKPTPSIYKTQPSVDLDAMENGYCTVFGRHDPCIARRAVPVAEAMTAFAIADAILADEASRPRLCLTLTASTLQQDLEFLKGNWPFAELCELRADCLDREQLPLAREFASRAEMPVILTIRRQCDGGNWTGSEEERAELLAQLLEKTKTPFAYVDFEDDFRRPDLECLALKRGTRIIRSLHDFNGPVANIPERSRQMRGTSLDIPKIAFKVNHCSELETMFRETQDFTDFPHIVCAMGTLGQASRILAERTHSMLTFATPQADRGNTLGQLDARTLVTTYGFRKLTAKTELYAVTGWPLGHSLSPELNNGAFFKEAKDAVMVPLPSETAAEALKCAQTLNVRGIAVTVPHKKEMLPLMQSISEEAVAVGAVNTVIRTEQGWHGANTDIAGFSRALLAFLGRGDLTGCKVAILGAGGAANAIAYVIAQLHGQACIFNRTLQKAIDLAGKYNFLAAPLNEGSRELLSEYRQIIIQATSLGLSSKKEKNGIEDPIPFYNFHGDEQIYDLIYSPAETVLMARARAAGCRVENGLSMLEEQAKEQRRLYFTFDSVP